MRKAYREKLSSLLKVHEDPVLVKATGTLDPEDDNEGDRITVTMTDPLSDLLISYNNSEEKVLQSLSSSNNQVARLEKALSTLHDQYRSCLDHLSEMQRTQGTCPFLISSILH